jgi:glycosyltransferase involved in cell wall biosynthesis
MPSQFSFAAFDILRKLNRPFLVEVVENAFEGYWYYPSFYGKLCAHYFNNKMKTVLQHAPYAVYVAQKLQKDYPTNGHSAILSNVLIEQILAVDKIENSRFNDAHFKIGLIGDMGVKYKGHSTLLKAVSLLDATVKTHIELYFIGAGNHEWITVSAKKLHLNKNIRFIGPLPHDKVITALQTLSLYVHPSFKEGLPRALLEAMSMGCPVLGSTNGGIPEVVKPEFLHKPGDYRTLAKQIKRFYDDRKLLKQEGLFNLENVKPFSKKDLGKRRFDFYSQLINKTE